MNETKVSHPTQTELESFFHGTLEESRRQAVEDHIGRCDRCCDVLRTIPHDPLVERIHAATSSVDDGETPYAGPTQITREDAADTVPSALMDHPRYRIIRRLGQGGMGVVYQAQHKLMERNVALKVINARLVSSDLAVERFRQEVKAAAKLSHRNIVTAFDAEQAGDAHFLVMEYIDGISLAELIARRKTLPVLHACNYILQAAQGLHHASQRGMVHRDIKPHNLMRTTRGTIKILDFGLARFATEGDGDASDPGLTADFTALGTPDYMAPEQARDSKRADVRSDLYSLGCTLYYLLSGQVPFPDGTAFEKVIGHCERQPRPLSDFREDIPTEVVQIVERLMAKDPDDRFQTPAELVEAIKPFGKPDSPYANENQAPTPNTVLSMPAMAPPMPAKLTVQSEKPSERVRSQQTTIGPQGFGTHHWVLAGMTIGVVLVAGWFLLSGDEHDPDIAQGEQNQQVTPPLPDPTPRDNRPNTDRWTELIPTIDLSRDVVAGRWERTPGGQLHVDAEQAARVMIPFDPPREYDFEVRFTRHSGEESIALHFVDGSGNATFDIDGWSEHLAGIQNIDSRDMRTNPTRAEGVALANGRTYTAEVRVRRDRVEALLDGRLIATYEGDGSNLSMLSLWTLPHPSLGLGAYDCETTFQSVRIRAISP
ncbi:serine/threonine-protein kinase [Blastopirellula marina]|uniref:Protein kinase domain-containing protein n=1 Tax=Blastopirellula marina TaxID=124 RepID=A0A2S8GC29_9BACT|nr:serine/threonine-protein kinase [Blastopirellula marina]PQO41979.1 hypothetical protein C5Y93_26830 [Blastopirellula marina]